MVSKLQRRTYERPKSNLVSLSHTLEENPEAFHLLASGIVSAITRNPAVGITFHTWVWHSPFTDLWKSETNYQPSPDIYNQDSSKVNILSPVHESESSRQVPSSSQQVRRRGGIPKGSEMVKPSWVQGVHGRRLKRPACPPGYKLRRIGKRLVCVRSDLKHMMRKA